MVALTANPTKWPTWRSSDNLGTVRDLAEYDDATDTTTIVDHYVYDAFGNETDHTGTNDFLFKYTGRAFDDETGLQNNLNRWFDPTVGRWLSEDPIGFEAGDANVYRYVGNFATGATDPSGLAPPGMFTRPLWEGGGGSGSPKLNPRPAPSSLDGFWHHYGHYVNPFISHSAHDWIDSMLQWGTRCGQVMAVGGAGGAAGVTVAGVGGITIGGAGVAGGAALGVGSQAVVAPGLGAGTYPALLINGTVYVARFHVLASEMAGGIATYGACQKYGMVIIDATGKVIGWK